MTRFNYIVTIHNREDLIERVVMGILTCAGEHSHIYLVLDGCTDGTERIVDQLNEDSIGLPITKLQAPDVHEIRSLNIALRQVPMEGDGYNILVQDDVIIGDRNFEKKIRAVYAHFAGRIGVLSFRHGVNLAVDAEQIEEVDLIESSYGYGSSAAILAPGFAVERMVCLRSPQCLSFDTVRQVGLLDEKYAPYTYDDHDYGMRCLQSGRTNVVYSVKYRSRVEWGGMRRKPQPGVAAIMKRNKGYVYDDYRAYIASLSREAFLREPVFIAGAGESESAERVMERYEMSRARLLAFNRRRSLDIFRRLREKLGF